MNKIFGIVITWVVVVAAYLILALVMPAISSISTESAANMDASANMSNFPGTKETVQSSPYWLWAIPGMGGIIATVVLLRREDNAA